MLYIFIWENQLQKLFFNFEPICQCPAEFAIREGETLFRIISKHTKQAKLYIQRGFPVNKISIIMNVRCPTKPEFQIFYSI